MGDLGGTLPSGFLCLFILWSVYLLLIGITLTTLWKRLQERKADFSLKVDEQCKEYLWSSVISRHDGLSFFELDSDRPALVTVHTKRLADPNTGVITEEQRNVSYKIGVPVVVCTFLLEWLVHSFSCYNELDLVVLSHLSSSTGSRRQPLKISCTVFLLVSFPLCYRASSVKALKLWSLMMTNVVWLTYR